MAIQKALKGTASDNEYYEFTNNINKLSGIIQVKLWDSQERERAETRKRILEEITRLYRLLVIVDSSENSSDRIPRGGG